MSIGLDDKFIITFSNKSFKTISQNLRNCCKVMKFPSECSHDEILLSITDLCSNEFPYLYFFIIEYKNYEFCKNCGNEKPEKITTLEKFLLKFNKNRPIILQIEAENEGLRKVYYKDENICEFLEINQQSYELGNLHHFPNFFSFYLNGGVKIIDDELLNKIIRKENSSLAIRLLRTVKISDDALLKKIIFACAARGSKSQLIAALDIAFEFNKFELNHDALDYLSNTCYFDSECNEFEQSILLTAVENYNEEIVNFLLTRYKPLLLKLPIIHQIDISNIAFDTNQILVLCNLLKCDFPFPENFDSSSTNDKKLQKIIDDHQKFHEWIESKNFTSMDEFIEENSNRKMIYNVKNDSALYHAMNFKNYDVYYFLKSYGFQGENLRFIEVAEDKKDLEHVQNMGVYQRRKNVMNAIQNEDSSVMTLIAKSFIHNQIMTDQTKLKYINNIEKWFREINKTEFASGIFHVASQCDDLKIIFDFESENVHNIDLNATSSLGITYSSFKRIFIGAESSNFKNREQKIKGVLLHEICHYALRLVFENMENPYYEFDEEKILDFEKIVSTYKKYGEEQLELDDECEGILSSMYKNYKEQDYHIELIVIAPQIQAEYDKNREKVKILENKYELLFSYMRDYVMPEMEKFNLKNRNDVRKFNSSSKIFSDIEKLSQNVKLLKNSIHFTGNNFIIVQTNVQKLFFLNAFNVLHKKYRSLINARNIFTTKDILEKSPDFGQLLSKTKPNFVFINFSKQFDFDIKTFKNKKYSTFIFVVKHKDQFEKAKEILLPEKIKFDEFNEIFTWNDLSNESQNFLIDSNVTFQGCTTLTLKDIIPVSMETDERAIPENIYQDIINDDLLNLLIEREEIKVNAKVIDQTTDKSFKCLFQTRKILKIQNISNNKKFLTLTYDELLISVKNEKYILISDIAGTGKSWQLKKMEELLRNVYPKKWTSYVDLKQYISAFKSNDNLQDFTLFMIENIFKLENKFESKIFRTMYENGDVIILFDGYDEIAPDCVIFVNKLIQSFMFNNGNQVWIATRDYFEHELKENLKINTVYKLKNFSPEENSCMLSSRWILYDLEKNSQDIPENNFLKWIKCSPNFENYQKSAQNLSTEILCSKVHSIGSPLFYKMTADIFKDDKTKIIKVTVPEVYKKFIKIQILRWSKEKGEIRENASVDQNLSKVLSHREIHQLFAMISLFPECSEFCDLDINDCDWEDEEIIGCGIVSKKDGTFYFPHETFREYYAADFIARVLCGKKPDIINLSKYLLIFITTRKYGIIRMFLNEAISETNVRGKIYQYSSKISNLFFSKIDKLVNLSDIFEENLENLVKFIIDLLKFGTYDEIKVIFNNNKGIINLILKNSKIFENFQDLIVNNFNKNDAKKFILDFKIYQKLASATIDGNLSKNFISNIQSKIDVEFSNEALKTQNEFGDNIIFCLIQSNFNGIQKIESFFETLQVSLTDQDLITLMKQQNNKGWNVIHAAIDSKDDKKLEFLWNNMKKFFDFHNLLHDFRELCTQKSNDQKTILHISTSCQSTEFHDLLWNRLSLQEILSSHELNHLISHKDQQSVNYVHSLVMISNAQIIVSVFEILKNCLTEDQFNEILRSKGTQKRNLLQVAACSSKEIQTHKFLWKIIKKSCKSPIEFLNILEETDESDNNIFNIAASFVTKEILEFMDQELEKILSNDKIKQLMCNLNIYMSNMFQLAAHNNKSFEFCEMMWKIIWKRFNSSEIFELITHRNKYGHNMLIVTIAKNSKEVTNFTWDQVSRFIKENFSLTEEENEKLNQCDEIIRNFLPSNDIKGEEKEILKFKWLENISTNNLFGQYYQLNENVSIKTLMSFTSNENLESHKNLWKHLIETFKDRSKLMQLLSKKDRFGDKFILTLVEAQTLDIIQYTFNVLKEILSDDQYYEIVMSRGHFSRYLIQRTALLSKNHKLYEFIFQMFRDTCKTKEEFLSILQKSDDTNNNIVNLSAAYGSKENFEFIISELENCFKHDVIKKMFSQLSIWNQNILQLATKRNRSIELHRYLWEIIYKYFNYSEVLQFIKHIEARSNNLILVAIELNGREILNLIWQECIKVLDQIDFTMDEKRTKILKQCDNIIKHISQLSDIKEDEKDILKLKWVDDCSTCLFEFALIDEKTLAVKSMNDLIPFMSDNNLRNHEVLWNHILNKIENSLELKNLLTEKDKDDESYIHLLTAFNSPNIIEQTFKTLKDNLSESQLQEVLRLPGKQKRNLLQKAIILKKPKTVELLWKFFSNLYKSKNEFFEFLLEIDEDGNNILNLAACYTTVEIFNYLCEELERNFSSNEFKKIMNNLNFEKRNLLQSACVLNKSLIYYEHIWKMIDKHFENFEMIEFIKNCEKSGFHLFSTAIYYGSRDIVNLTWTKIKIVLDKKDDIVQYLNIKANIDENIYILALKNKTNDPNVVDLVQNIIKEYDLEI